MLAFRSMVLRVSREGTVLYANQAFAAYCGKRREEILGATMIELAFYLKGEMVDFFKNVRDFSKPNTLVADANGHVFEQKTSLEHGVLDIVLDEVTQASRIEEVVAPVSGTPLEDLSEEELRTVRTPDLRFLKLCSTFMQTGARLARGMSAMEQRILSNAFLEETSEALLACGCTLMPSRNGSMLGMAGAPRHYADHAFRALNAAFDQIDRMGKLRDAFYLEQKEMPPISCGIASGDAIVGAFGGQRTMHYAAEGVCVETAERLSRMAAPGEVLITEPTLMSLFNNLPPGWEVQKARREEDWDLAPYSAFAGEILPVTGDNIRRSFLIGPGVQGNIDAAVFVFDFLWMIPEANSRDPIGVLRAGRVTEGSLLMPLREEKVPAVGFITRMGKYRLDEVIASGGMGRVWRAQDIYGNTVAIKTLNKDQALSADSVKRFRREAEIMSRLHHRNICHIFEISEHEGLNYIVMEFIDGPTLSDILYSTLLPGSEKCSSMVDMVAYLREARMEPREAKDEDGDESSLDDKLKHPTTILPLDEVLNFFEKVCEAVQFGHQHGVLHRDIKPGNILVRNDGEPIVSDFGLAKFSTTNNAASFSMSGAVVGTIENMAPEQAESSKTVDARADIYSLGTVLYQMLTGTRHFTTTGNFLADLQSLQHHEPPRPRTINPRIDPDLELIILKCLRNDPNERYPRVSALLTDIHRYRRGESIIARPLTFWYVTRKIIRRNKVASAIAAASLFLITLITLAAVWSLSRELNNEKSARQEADKLRKVAEENRNLANQKQAEALEKENYAIELAKKASEQTALAQQLLDEKHKMEEMASLALKRREDFAAKKIEDTQKRAQAEENARKNAATLQQEIEKLKAELDAQKSVAMTNPIKESPKLLTPVRIPLFNNGKPVGFVTAPKGAEVEITDETREKYQITHSLGQAYVDKSAVAIPPQYKPAPSQPARSSNPVSQ